MEPDNGSSAVSWLKYARCPDYPSAGLNLAAQADHHIDDADLGRFGGVRSSCADHKLMQRGHRNRRANRPPEEMGVIMGVGNRKVAFGTPSNRDFLHQPRMQRRAGYCRSVCQRHGIALPLAASNSMAFGGEHGVADRRPPTAAPASCAAAWGRRRALGKPLQKTDLCVCLWSIGYRSSHVLLYKGQKPAVFANEIPKHLPTPVNAPWRKCDLLRPCGRCGAQC